MIIILKCFALMASARAEEERPVVRLYRWARFTRQQLYARFARQLNSRMKDGGFLFVRYKRHFCTELVSWEHVACPLSGIKRRPLVGGWLNTSCIVFSIRAVASVHYRGCPLVGGSVMGGSTVHTLYTTCLHSTWSVLAQCMCTVVQTAGTDYIIDTYRNSDCFCIEAMEKQHLNSDHLTICTSQSVQSDEATHTVVLYH